MCNGYDMSLSLQLLSSAATQSVEVANRKKKQQLMSKCKVHMNMNQLSLVWRQAVENKNNLIQELRYKVENSKSAFDEQLQEIANEKNAELNRL